MSHQRRPTAVYPVLADYLVELLRPILREHEARTRREQERAERAETERTRRRESSRERKMRYDSQRQVEMAPAAAPLPAW